MDQNVDVMYYRWPTCCSHLTYKIKIQLLLSLNKIFFLYIYKHLSNYKKFKYFGSRYHYIIYPCSLQTYSCWPSIHCSPIILMLP